MSVLLKGLILGEILVPGSSPGTGNYPFSAFALRSGSTVEHWQGSSLGYRLKSASHGDMLANRYMAPNEKSLLSVRGFEPQPTE